MKVIAINGSPRKSWNTGKMLQSALAGSAAEGAETELIHLYDLEFKGCISCFACKKDGGKSYGRCAVEDDLTPVFKRIAEADALILGTPMYLGSASGEMRSFFERLIFPYLCYSFPRKSLAPKQLKTAYIYTMNVPEDKVNDVGYPQYFAQNEGLLKMIFGGSPQTLCSYETYQFDDYSKYVHQFDVEQRLKRHQQVFPEDLEKARELGARLVGAAK